MILAIETSSKLCSVALIQNQQCIDCLEELGEKFIHAESLHPMIQKLLDRNNIKLANLNGIAVGIGPGSYTGLRIGLAAAKGFAFALKFPLYAANTDQLLRASLTTAEQSNVFTVVDARRQDAYVGTPSGEYAFQTVDASWRANYTNQSIIVIGDCAEKVEVQSMDTQLTRFPSAAYFAQLLETNCKFVDDVGALEPFYMKEFEPTISKKKITDL